MIERKIWEKLGGPLLVPVLTLTACASGSVAEEPEAVSSATQALVTSQTMTATLTQTSRWSGGYCGNVVVKNSGPKPISGWSVDIRTPGTLSSSWNADASISSGHLKAGAQPFNAVLAVGATAQFGYCVATSSTIAPQVVSAAGQVGEPGAGYAATLKLDTDWGSGYCATVKVSNQTGATIPSWTVVMELNASSMTSNWDSKTSASGSRVTFTPQSYNSVLPGSGATSFGFCASRTGSDYRPRVVSPTPTSTVKALSVAVYLPKRVATCFIGDACTPGTSGCIGLMDDANTLKQGFVDATMQAVKTTSSLRAGAQKEVCVEMVTTDQERSDILHELAATQANVRQWSHEDVQLDLHIIDFDRLDMDEARWGEGVWINPWNMAEFARPRLDFMPDFNLVVPPIRDPRLGLHHGLGGCGGTFGADYGLAGGGWSWVPKTKTSFWFDCAEQPVFTHEWLHQVHYAYHNLSGYTDIYNWSLPICGAGDSDPHRWFPDSHQCAQDPDYAHCGGDCGSNDEVNSHILSEHWDPSLGFKANYCKDGVQDFDETASDIGPSCSLTAH